jgi:DNA polymerase-1
VYVETDGALDDAMPVLLAAPALGLDCETSGLDPHADRLRLVQLATPERVYLVDAFRTEIRKLAPVFAAGGCPRLVGFNLGFDLRFLMAAGLPVPDGPRLFDCMLAAQVADAGEHLHEPGRFTLAAVAMRELGAEVDKSEQKAGWDQAVLPPEKLRYAAEDAAVVLPLARELTDRLAADGLEATAGLEFGALPVVAWTELTGAPFDRGRWLALAREAEAALPALREAVVAHARSLGPGWQAVVNPRPERKQRATGAGGKDGCRQLTLDLSGVRGGAGVTAAAEVPAAPFNPGSRDQQLRLLRALGVGAPDARETTLVALRGRHPAVRDILALKDAAKKATAFGTGYLRHAHPATGRIHASYFQVGSEAGRMSCTGPNLQQVPREVRYRNAFRARPGRVLVKADYAQIELCVAAELSGDERMLRALNAGEDLHRLTAAALYGKPPGDVTPAERGFGKNMNFASVFGQGVRGLIARATAQGIALGDAEARGFLARFAGAWPRLDRWKRDRMRGTGPEVRTASGRLRRLAPEAPGTFRANTPVQGTAADGFKAALAELWATRRACPSGAPVLLVHDELVVECDAAEAEAAVAWVVRAMEAGMRRYVRRAPVRVDARVAQAWGGEPVEGVEGVRCPT